MTIKKNESDSKSRNSFQPPKLPIAWIASTFIGPTLVVILPILLSSESSSFTVSLIIALVLLSISLLVICFTLILRLYDESYSRQMLEFKIDELIRTVDELRNDAIAERKVSQALQENLIQEQKSKADMGKYRQNENPHPICLCRGAG